MEILNGGISCRQRAILWLLIIALVGIPIGSPGQDIDEYEVKAAFLYNFTKFVEWPIAIDTPSFTICVLGDDPFQSALDRLTAGKKAYGHPIQIRRLKEVAEAKQCQIVFVGAAERTKAARLIGTTRGSPVFTVGESQDFVRIGGMVFLSIESNHISVVIHKIATDSAGFKISANLMTLAKIYKP
jgi:hypothetical protein